MRKNGRFPQLLLLTIISLLSGLLMINQLATVSPSQAAAASADSAMYIILLDEPSVVGMMAQAGTQDAAIMKLAEKSVQTQQAQAIEMMTQLVKRPLSISHQYQYALNGMAVALTTAEADQLRAQPGIQAVVASQMHHPLSDVSPSWLGAPSLWDGSQTGGIAGTQGEGIVIGIIDTGINMDHPSFAAVGGDGYVHTNPNGAGNYLGHCATQPETTRCNDKLIGAYSWPEVGDNPEDDYVGGHGSNVAGIAAGNIITYPYTAPTIVLTPTMSGIAPHANIIAYDICSSSDCPDTLAIAAIEQAIIDGVDVINYSIGSNPLNPWQDPVALAFLSAREANIFVAVAAGNSGTAQTALRGPGNAPWVTTAGNLSHNGRFDNILGTFSGGDTTLPDFRGSSITSGTGSAPIVTAAQADAANATCNSAFAANTWTQEIVYCTGAPSYTRVNNVRAGGGVGVVFNSGKTYYQELRINRYNLPTVDLRTQDAAQLVAWLSSGSGHTATISGTERARNATYADEMNLGSSRGPNLMAMDILKPNLAAPGTKIWAAGMTEDPDLVPPVPPEFSFWTGTSQASPHVAGSGALLKVLHPDWTPSEIESALMMTAVSTVHEADGSPATPFARGAGRIDLTAVSRAGLVLNETGSGFRAANPDYGQAASQLNLASLTTANCGSTCIWTRELRSTLAEPATWQMTVTQPITAVLSVTPTLFTLQPGQTQLITVTAVAHNLAPDTWNFGTLNLVEVGNKAPNAHLPVTLKHGEQTLPKNIEIHTRQDAGSHEQTNLQAFGITSLTVQSVELVRGTITETQLAQNEMITYTLTVPANSKRLAVEILSTTAYNISLFVRESGQAQGNLCNTASGWWTDPCNLIDPAPGNYEIVLNNTAGSGAIADMVMMATAVVPNQPAINNWITGALGQAVTEPFALRYFWQESALESGERWYGGFELGTNPVTPDDLGFIPVTLVRHADDVEKTIIPATVSLGSEITTHIRIEPNVTPLSLVYVVTETIPAGITVTQLTAPPGTLTQIDDFIRWEGVLPPLGTETAVIQYNAIVEASACNQTLVSPLNYLVQRPGSQPKQIESMIDVVCAQIYLPAIQKE